MERFKSVYDEMIEIEKDHKENYNKKVAFMNLKLKEFVKIQAGLLKSENEVHFSKPKEDFVDLGNLLLNYGYNEIGCSFNTTNYFPTEQRWYYCRTCGRKVKSTLFHAF